LKFNKNHLLEATSLKREVSGPMRPLAAEVSASRAPRVPVAPWTAAKASETGGQAAGRGARPVKFDEKTGPVAV
jgi:hypothetical protein